MEFFSIINLKKTNQDNTLICVSYEHTEKLGKNLLDYMVTVSMKATFAAGCFWGIESLFRQVKGVESTQVGYTGGTLENPTYEDVCSGRTGHAESIQIDYDPSVVSYDELLKIFWSNHNPTTINQQGPDIGEQYRSVIFFHNPEQEKTAKELMEKLQLVAIKRFGKKIVTEIVPAKTFFRAEEYHQRYLEKNSFAHCSSKLN